MSASVTGVPSADSFTTLDAISSTDVVRTIPRTIYSFPYWFRIPPAASAFIDSVAANNSSRLTP